MRYSLILMLLLLSSCSTLESFVKSEQLVSTEDAAKLKVKPNLDLPPEISLDKYKLDAEKVKQYKEGDMVYIAIPEQDMLIQQEFLLVLKSRIAELQRIILDAKKLM